MTYREEAIELINRSCERLDAKLWNDIKRVQNHQGRDAKRKDILAQVDLLSEFKKQLNILLTEK